MSKRENKRTVNNKNLALNIREIRDKLDQVTGWSSFNNTIKLLIPMMTIDQWRKVEKEYFVTSNPEFLLKAIIGKNTELVRTMIEDNNDLFQVSTIIQLIYNNILTSTIEYLLDEDVGLWIIGIRKCINKINSSNFQRLIDHYSIYEDVKDSVFTSGRLDLLYQVSRVNNISPFLSRIMIGANPDCINYTLNLSECNPTDNQIRCFDFVKRKDYIQAREYIFEHRKSPESLYLFFSLPGKDIYPRFMYKSIIIPPSEHRRTYMFLFRHGYTDPLDDLSLDNDDKVILNLEGISIK